MDLYGVKKSDKEELDEENKEIIEENENIQKEWDEQKANKEETFLMKKLKQR